MSPRDWRERIQDIIDSAREIQSFIGGYTLERFRQDVKTIRAVGTQLHHHRRSSQWNTR